MGSRAPSAPLDEFDEGQSEIARNSNLPVGENLFVIDPHAWKLTVLRLLIEVETNRVESPGIETADLDVSRLQQNPDTLPLAPVASSMYGFESESHPNNEILDRKAVRESSYYECGEAGQFEARKRPDDRCRFSLW